MTTTTTTTTAPASSSPASHPASTPRGSRGRTIFVSAVGVVAGAGLAAGLVLGLGGGSTGPTPTVSPTASTSTGTHAERPATSGAAATGGSGHSTPAAPSAAIETLQEELGRLDYYEGPVTGVMDTGTTQAIEYLQRDAHLPQTGRMDAATQAALADFLAGGNNQMGGTS